MVVDEQTSDVRFLSYGKWKQEFSLYFVITDKHKQEMIIIENSM